MDYRDIIEAYVEVRPDYEELSQRVHHRLDEGLSEAYIRHWCLSRTKDVASFVKTAVKRNYSDPLNEITDKAGVRVLIPFADLEGQVEHVVRQCFNVLWDDDKRSKLSAGEFGYNALHLQVSLKATVDNPVPRILEDLTCEIQIHTLALNAWSEVSHDLIYKPTGEVTYEFHRRMNRLIALAEVFDSEVARTRRELQSADNYLEAWMLSKAEALYLPLVKTDFDRELSLIAMSVLVKAYADDEVQSFERLLQEAISARSPQLEAIYSQYSELKWNNPFLFQPEALVIYERLRARPQRLKAVWNDGALPSKILEDLADIFGEPI